MLLDSLLQWNFLTGNPYMLLPRLLLVTVSEMANSGFLSQASGILGLALAEPPFLGILLCLS